MLDRQYSRPLRGDFVVGGWRVEPGCNRIFRCGGGVERKLEPRLMHLLCLLAANPNRTLSRDDLVAELWPRVIVTENSLTRAVSELRKHLRAAGGGLVKIETVPKKGYRLVVEQAAKAGSRRRALPWPAFALPAFAMAVVAGGWLAERGADPLVSHQSEATLAEFGDFGQEYVPASSPSVGLAELRHEAPVLSADGSRFAFIRHDASGSTIWLGDLSGGTEPVAVYGSSLPLANLVWSPTGDALLFARQGAIAAEALYSGVGSGQLMRFDLNTWAVSILAEEPEQTEPSPPPEIDLT